MRKMLVGICAVAMLAMAVNAMAQTPIALKGTGKDFNENWKNVLYPTTDGKLVNAEGKNIVDLGRFPQTLHLVYSGKDINAVTEVQLAFAGKGTFVWEPTAGLSHNPSNKNNNLGWVVVVPFGWEPVYTNKGNATFPTSADQCGLYTNEKGGNPQFNISGWNNGRADCICDICDNCGGCDNDDCDCGCDGCTPCDCCCDDDHPCCDCDGELCDCDCCTADEEEPYVCPDAKCDCCKGCTEDDCDGCDDCFPCTCFTLDTFYLYFHLAGNWSGGGSATAGGVGDVILGNSWHERALEIESLGCCESTVGPINIYAGNFTNGGNPEDKKIGTLTISLVNGGLQLLITGQATVFKTAYVGIYADSNGISGSPGAHPQFALGDFTNVYNDSEQFIGITMFVPFAE